MPHDDSDQASIFSNESGIESLVSSGGSSHISACPPAPPPLPVIPEQEAERILGTQSPDSSSSGSDYGSRRGGSTKSETPTSAGTIPVPPPPPPIIPVAPPPPPAMPQPSSNSATPMSSATNTATKAFISVLDIQKVQLKKTENKLSKTLSAPVFSKTIAAGN